MEQKLNITLRKFAFEFEPIGPEHDYYGPVIPFLGTISELEKRIYKKKPEVAHLMIHGLETSLMPKLAFAFPLRNFLAFNVAKILRKI